MFPRPRPGPPPPSHPPAPATLPGRDLILEDGGRATAATVVHAVLEHARERAWPVHAYAIAWTAVFFLTWTRDVLAVTTVVPDAHIHTNRPQAGGHGRGRRDDAFGRRGLGRGQQLALGPRCHRC